MKVLNFESLQASLFPNGSIVTLGNFDGLHKGHFALISEVQIAKEKFKLPSVLVTYFPNPAIVLGKNKDLKSIYSEKKKIEILSKTEIDFYLSIPFTQEFSKITALQFIQEILFKKLNAKYIVIGYNHFFGKDKEGDFQFLLHLSEKFGYQVKKIEPVYLGDEKIASSSIRSLIQSGDIEKANGMLGRPFSIEGDVVYGEARGRTIQFPTANISVPSNLLVPARGVYIGVTRTETNHYFQSMINIGFKPTFEGTSLTIESHLIGFDANLYEKQVELFFFKRLRNEKKFQNVDELVQQLILDKKNTVQFFEENPTILSMLNDSLAE